GITKAQAFAAPVEEGMMLPEAALPPLQSFLEGPSTVFCVAVVECTVVIRPSTMPNLSLRTLVMGARQLVVQDALETTFMSGVYLSRFTPQTKVGVSLSFAGAEMTTFLAPPLKWAEAFSVVQNTPVDSTMYSAPQDFQLMLAGSISA